ncbi:MAG: endonuclease MutS2 [Spirochaetota bacterium]
MNTHALERLEFERLREQVLHWCRSETGRERLRRAAPSADAELVHALQEDVAALRDAMREEDLPGEVSFPAVTELLQRVAKEGAVLEAAELNDLAGFARSAGRLRRFLEKRLPRAADRRGIRERVEELPDLSAFHKQIGRYIDVRGELLERHIPELRRLSSAIRAAQSKVERVAGEFMKERSGDYWNVDHPVLREGRIVLPLKARYQSRVDGVVHEHSQTGQTVFIEPSVLVKANNELRGAEDRYRQEVFRILKELSAAAREHRPGLERADEIVAEVDALYARARFSVTIDGVRPEASEVEVRLPQVRHPLIGTDVVPIDLNMEGETRHLIVTGPNTGGKTVALKTVGLAALMHQFGLQVPALPGAALPVFDDVFADIGDEQSLEQSLSTFSGHMRQIAVILSEATERSLVLLDELGAGTDPAEGGALAMAILDELRERGCHAIVTTHHGALKSYGYTHENVQNASVEFNVETLSPTYRLLTGVPGSSHGITIARRNGLPQAVVDRASAYAEEGRGDAAQIIQRLGEEEERLYREAEEVRRRRRRIEEQEDDLARQSEKLADKERQLRRQELGAFQSFAAEARSRLENLVRELREGEITREKTGKVRRFAEELEEAAREEESRIAEIGSHADGRRPGAVEESQRADRIGEADTTTEGGGFEPGMEVLLKSTRRRGVLQRRARKNSWVVVTDSVRVTVSEDDLEPARTAAGGAAGVGTRGGRPDAARTGGPAAGGRGASGGARPEIPTVQFESAGEQSRPSLELDVRGRTLAEAIDQVDSQIDRALMTGLYRFGIIHGKGTGVLQRGIREHLDRSPVVDGFSYAPPEEGGYGKTVVELSRQ